MSPGLAQYDTPSGMFGHIGEGSNLGIREPLKPQLSDPSHHVIREFGAPVIRTSSQSFWMRSRSMPFAPSKSLRMRSGAMSFTPCNFLWVHSRPMPFTLCNFLWMHLRPMSFASWKALWMRSRSMSISCRYPSLYHCISCIIGGRPQKQVVWTDALRSVAPVTAKKPIGNGTKMQDPGNSVSSFFSEKPISGFLEYTCRPHPARAEVWNVSRNRSVSIHLRPKAFLDFGRDLRQRGASQFRSHTARLVGVLGLGNQSVRSLYLQQGGGGSTISRVFLLVVAALALTGCSTPDNDVIDQAIAARIYNRGAASTFRK
jgi:hypothetical protein